MQRFPFHFLLADTTNCRHHKYIGFYSYIQSPHIAHSLSSPCRTTISDDDDGCLSPLAGCLWGPVLIELILFVLLQPGLLFQLLGNGKQVEFRSMKTNGKAIAVYTLIFFTIYSILILAVHVHIYTG